MKNKLFLLVAVILVAAMVFPTPAYAWTGVTGQVIDSLNLDPWAYGGQVWVVNNTNGTILIAAELDINGAFNFAWLTDTLGPLGVCGGSPCVDATAAPASTNSLELVIIPYPGPNGTPGVISRTFNQNVIPARYNPGYLETGTGPTALELVDFSVTPQSSNNTWLPFVLLVGSVALVSGAVTVIRKRRA